MTTAQKEIKRNGKGQFAPGTKPGGRLPRQTEMKYLHVMMDTCTEESWRIIVNRAVIDAKKGNRHARDFLARYLLPKPDRIHGDSPLIALNFGTPMPTGNEIDAAIDRRIRELMGTTIPTAVVSP